MIDRNEIVDMFKEFMGEPIPEMVTAYGTDHDKMIVQVFVVVKESKVMGTTEVKTEEEYVFPIAKVFNIGQHFDAKGRKYEVGKYVRLRDIDAMTIINARHEVFHKHEFSGAVSTGEIKQVGKGGPKILQLLWINFGGRIFSPDPFALEWKRRMSDVFYLDSANVVCPIVEPEKFFKPI